MFITISFNLINNEKNIKHIKKYEIIEKDVSDIQIEKQNNNKNPTIILILDEMNGAGGLNKDIKAFLEISGLKEGARNYPAEFVQEKAFVASLNPIGLGRSF